MPDNRAERGAGQLFRQWRDCLTCGRPVEGGTRGPLPRRHPGCQPADAQLLYQVRSAARLAHRVGRQAVGFELDAIAAVLQVSVPRAGAVAASTAAGLATVMAAPAPTRFGE